MTIHPTDLERKFTDRGWAIALSAHRRHSGYAPSPKGLGHTASVNYRGGAQ